MSRREIPHFVLDVRTIDGDDVLSQAVTYASLRQRFGRLAEDLVQGKVVTLTPDTSYRVQSVKMLLPRKIEQAL
jgi:hypothetical protein